MEAAQSCEVVEQKPVNRRPVDDPSATPRKGRSRVTNGKVLIAGVDQRSPWVRRCKDVIAAHLSDLGGADNTSTAERSIIRRAAVLTTELEVLDFFFQEEDGIRAYKVTGVKTCALPISLVLAARRCPRSVTTSAGAGSSSAVR